MADSGVNNFLWLRLYISEIADNGCIYYQYIKKEIRNKNIIN